MMAITEEDLKEADEAEENSGSEEVNRTFNSNGKLNLFFRVLSNEISSWIQDEFGNIPVEFMDLYNDEELKQTLIDLILTASDLDILDFQVENFGQNFGFLRLSFTF